MSLITPDFGLLFWMTIIFAIVLFILAKWGFPVITDMVAKRQDRINESIRLAQLAEQKAAQMDATHAQMLEQARREQASKLPPRGTRSSPRRGSRRVARPKR